MQLHTKPPVQAVSPFTMQQTPKQSHSMQAAVTPPTIHWTEQGAERSARWHSEAGMPPPKKVIVADDTTNADTAYRLACEGTALLWRGDFHNARLACNEAYGRGDDAFVISLRELQGVIGAHEWRKTGVEIAALDARIHPHYGVFSPMRGEYVQLVAEAPLPRGARELAFDIGAGTGVLSAVLAKRGVARVVATDMDRRALSCARDNIARLHLDGQVELVEADMFPPGRAPLVVCNPPWVPARPGSSIESAIYDPDSRMLKAFLAGLKDHLTEGGEGWLILSDLAEHLGLRPRAQLLEWIEQAGLKVIDRSDVRPVHPRASDASDPLHAARSAELTSLWRLGAA